MNLLSSDLEPLWIARYDYQAGWRLPVHAHDDYFQAILILHGEGTVLIEQERHPFKKDQLFFFPPGRLHGLETAPRGAVKTLDTKFLIRKAALKAACRELPAVRDLTSSRITVLFEAIYAEARRQQPYSNELCRVQLMELVLLLLANETQGARPNTDASYKGTFEGREDTLEDPLCEQIRMFFREHYTEKIDQKRLGASLNYSYRHLHDAWHRRHQESPLQALVRYRVEQAMHLIRYSDYELKRIAEMTGFATVHHFTRIFTRVTGVPPGQWRNHERSNAIEDVVLQPGFVNRALTVRTTK